MPPQYGWPGQQHQFGRDGDGTSISPRQLSHLSHQAPTGATRIYSWRLSEQLKARIEEAAAREKISANVWLVRAAAAALDSAAAHRPVNRGRIGSQQFTGWVR